VIATLHPEHTFEKVVIDAWVQQTWGANDTVLLDPRKDEDIGALVTPCFSTPDPVSTTL